MGALGHTEAAIAAAVDPVTEFLREYGSAAA